MRVGKLRADVDFLMRENLASIKSMTAALSRMEARTGLPPAEQPHRTWDGTAAHRLPPRCQDL